MAKQSQMVREAQDQAVKERPYLASQALWDSERSPEFGGQADILQVNIGEVAGPLEYLGHQPMVLEGQKTITVHLGATEGNETLRLPIAASFLRAMDQAEVVKGDKFLIRRTEDVAKKASQGKGQPMQIYAIKVISRVPRAPVSTATS